MDRRRFLELATWATVASGTQRKGFAANLRAGVQSEPAGRHAHSARAALTLNRVLRGSAPAFTHEFLLADLKPTAERRFTEYSGDLSGRYIGALATVARVYGWDPVGADAGQLDALVEQALLLQKPEGFFGAGFDAAKPSDNDMALLWGNGRLLVGLLEYNEWKPRPEVLAASRRLGDFLVKIAPMMLSRAMRDAFGAQHFASSYICWMQQTEGLALLYRATKDVRYRKLAEEIAAVIERRPGDHVHGYLTSLRGVMALHGETGDPALLKQCETAWSQITASKDALITGGVPEGWSPNNHRTEGCAECDWVRLNLALWQVTGEKKYAALAERAIFNELAFNQYETGDFGHRVYTETGLPAAGAVRAWWCCTLHGMRCFPAMAESAFRVKDRRVWLDFPLDGFVSTPDFAATSESRLGTDGTMRIQVAHAADAPVSLGVRRPEWAGAMKLVVNGKEEPQPHGQDYVAAVRTWKAGDEVIVTYAVQLRAEKSGDRTSYWFGPWLLGASASINSDYFNELTTQNRLRGATETSKAEAGRAFAVPEAGVSFKFTPAEFPDQPQMVELRAIAEQTGVPTTSWELRFLTSIVPD